jgi:hypothetical protein
LPDVATVAQGIPCQRLPATLHGVVFDIFGWKREPPHSPSQNQ